MLLSSYHTCESCGASVGKRGLKDLGGRKRASLKVLDRATLPRESKGDPSSRSAEESMGDSSHLGTEELPEEKTSRLPS
jgi:hypothetical protein